MSDAPVKFESLGEGRPAPSEIDARLMDAVTINEIALSEEFVRVPSDIAFFGQRYADAYKAAGDAKVHERKIEAATWVSTKLGAQARNEKLTVQDLTSLVDIDDDVLHARLETVRTEAEKQRARGNFDAVLAKRDMVISIGATQREEMKVTPSIRTQSRDAREYGSRG